MIEKITNWYLNIFALLVLTIITTLLIIVWAILGILVSPWFFLGYILTVILTPAIVILWIEIPSVLEW